MNKILIIVLCLLVLIAVTPLLANGKKPAPAAKCAVITNKNTQPVAVNAGARAWVGLDRAVTHSPVLKPIPSEDGGKDEVKPGKK